MKRYSSSDGKDTRYGFRWGAAEVTRVTAHKTKRGDTLWMRVATPRGMVDIYVSPTGMLRVFDRDGRELVPTPKPAGER